MISTLSQQEIKDRDQMWQLSLEQVEAAFDSIEKAHGDKGRAMLGRISLYYLITRILDWHEYRHPWSYARILEVDQEPNGCVDLWARGHGKSSIITIAKTLQDLIVYDQIAIVVFSHSFAKARKHTRTIKQILEQNRKLQRFYPSRFFADPKKQSPVWNDTQFLIKRKTVRAEPTLMTCGFERALPTGTHFDVLIYDDVITEESVTTAEQIEKSAYMFAQTKPLGTMNAVERIIGTRYAFNDLFQDLIDGGQYKIRLYPATDNGAEDGKPVMFTDKAWQRIISGGSGKMTKRMVANQYLLNPLAVSERIFNLDNLEIYEVRELKMNLVILVDPAHSKKKHSFDTAIVVIGIGGKKRKYLLDGACHKMNLGDRYRMLKALWWKWSRKPGIGHMMIGYETYGMGMSDVEHIRELQKREQTGFQRLRVHELEDTAKGRESKMDRIERMQPDIDAHMWFIPYDTQSGRFTNKQRHAVMTGNEDMIAQPIKVVDPVTKEIYDLTDEFKKQLSHFPLGAKIDLLDAASRVYDMEMHDPHHSREVQYIPEEYLT